MAVKTKVIKVHLLELFPKLSNLSRERMNNLLVALSKIPADDADEQAIKKVINDYNEVFKFEEIAKQDDTIRTLTKQLKDKEENPKPGDGNPKPNDGDDGNPKPGDKSNEDNEVLKTLSKLSEGLEKLTNTVNDMQSGKIIETKREKALKLISDSEILKKLPQTMQERFLKTIDFDSETSIEDQVAELEEENEDFIQNLADGKPNASTPPNGSGNANVSEDFVEELVDDL